jgi:iron-sulfur cluster repair protein YtfE (RIC family)
MAVTETLRKQHAEFVEAIRKIEAALNPQRLAAGEVRSQLSGLMGKLSMHLAMEDNALYPSLEKHADAKVRDIGKKFSSEMAGVKPALEAFARKWSETEMAKNPAEFCGETKKLFAVLADRIKRENTELYPLLERAA